jgi:glycogen(starch) synthase
MKVLMYGWEFPPDISGGLGMACFGIVNELAKKGIPIALVLPKKVENITHSNKISIIGCNTLKATNTTLKLEQLGISIDTYEIESLLHPYMTAQSYEQVLNNLGYCQHEHNFTQNSAMFTGKYGPHLLSEVFRYACVAGILAAKIPHDIIHAHDWLTGLAGIEAKKHSHKPFIFQAHALEYDRSGENVNQTVLGIEKHIMTAADKIVAVSQYTKDIIASRYGIPADKIAVVHNGTYFTTHTALKPAKRNYQLVIFVGRVTYQKGPWHFIEVARKMLEKRSDLHFIIAGTGDQLEEMIERVAALKIGKNVHFTGFLAHDKVQTLYQLADVYVMPSVSEPFGLTCLEALSNNIPVVISKQSGVAEVLNHVLKTDFWDSDDMVNKIMALLDYRVLREESLKRSNPEVKSLTWEQTAEKLINIYGEMV